MSDKSTTAGWIPIPFPDGCWAQHQLHVGIPYVPVASKLRISLSSVEGVLASIMVELYSMADYSRTAGRIPIPFAGGCWTRCQLRNCIVYVPVASRLRISLSSVEGGLRQHISKKLPFVRYGAVAS